jgi:hypothetical protein
MRLAVNVEARVDQYATLIISERPQGVFSRQLFLSDALDADAAEASKDPRHELSPRAYMRAHGNAAHPAVRRLVYRPTDGGPAPSGSGRGQEEEEKMPEHRIGTREEWQAARDELAKLEAEQARRNEEIKGKRLELPWVPVEKVYEFDSEEGKKTLAELFEGRSQLLAYNIMFGPEYENGACPGCTNLGDGLDGALVHLNHRDVTLVCFSRAPIERLSAYKKRMGWQFPYIALTAAASRSSASRCAAISVFVPSRSARV